MFYTKYRPQKFSEIVRPNDVADALSKQVAQKKTAHAYLFVGSRGTGKTTTARILAKSLNCLSPLDNGDPCDKCEVCISIKDGSYIDLIEIDAASNRGIDDIRDLKGNARLAPARGKRKIYIIDEVHMLTQEAFNALLKTLEEPPKNTVFILCTTEEHKVPETIKSRCQVYKFKRASISQIVEKLKIISKEEKIKISEEDLKKIAQASLGGFRDAENLLQQVYEGDINIDSLLSISSREIYIDFVNDLFLNRKDNALKTISRVFEEGVDLHLWSGELLKYLRELLFLKSGAVDRLEDLTKDVIQSMDKQTEDINLRWLLDLIERLLNAQKEIRSCPIPQLPLEIFVIETADGASNYNNGIDNNKPNGSKYNKGIDNIANYGSKVKKENITEKDMTNIPKNVVQVIRKQNKIKEEELVKNEENISSKKEEPENSTFSIEVIESKWKEVLKRSKDLNHSITALLKSGKVIDVKGKYVIFEVGYSFHKERLEAPRNRSLIEDLLGDIYGDDIKVKCTLCKEKPKVKKSESEVLTDYNVSLPPLEGASLLDVFDGGLPATTR